MRHLTVYQRLATIIAVLSITLFAVSAMQILLLRDSVLEERRTMVRNLVESATKILSSYDADAKAGRLEPERARQLAFAAIGAMRWGQYADYLGVYGTGPSDAGVTYVHANPKYINVNRWDFKDNTGKLLIQDIVRTARAGGGYVEYMAPRSGGGGELPKLSYVGAYGSGDKMLALQAGVYINDVDAVVYERAMWAGLGGLAGLVIAGVIAFWLGRGLVDPLSKTCEAMDELCKGNLAFDVPFVDRKNEIGRMARSLQVFKDHLAESERLRAEQEHGKTQAAEERRAVLARIADQFERSIGGVIQGTASAAGELQSSASSMSSIVEGTTTQSANVAAAAEQTAKNVQTVSASAEQLSSSIQEIARQVTQSSSIAQNAVSQATRTEAMVEKLVHATQKIGEVMALIQTIAGQTNLLALNATIESARAGEAGKGFAVVANEVKALSAQTAKATEDITSQIEAIRDATGSTVTAIREIGATIGQMNEITEAIAAAVEEQGAATKEIARSVQQAAEGTQGVMKHIVGVREASSQVGAAAAQVLSAAGQLGSQSDQLKRETGNFLGNVRAA
ncbi:putative methyl-accepting chemotaxis receptor/sensory transducer [Bradyrhizobium sp. STM 3843]|uniref:methyl-accepting chemotaxis protein n=1 Tax=Bradyrhizobium sp. STM 3843 TaxID=551947 RepID=UPI000240375F|nr:methyl-accepting chemotaxis protein [Bradyrhizobium sp. STM 3843]CCE11450.1 putative methyl-accepting chemotaxis receptor/sensory transducer [Bradyrhizobium sp. STM 3843]